MIKRFEPIELGDRIKDPITGLTGIATCITVWLHGCIRIGLQPETNKDGKKADDSYFDQSQLVILKKQVYAPMVLSVQPKPAIETRRSNGGPSREGPGFKR